jgi:hypothetical protein
VKSYFHYLFAGVLLLVGLMLYNNQKNGGINRATEKPDFVQVDFQAEICFSNMFRSPVPSGDLYTKVEHKIHTEHLFCPEQVNCSEAQIIYKAQMQLHLELKPDRVIQSGKNLYRFPRYGDPPVA